MQPRLMRTPLVAAALLLAVGAALASLSLEAVNALQERLPAGLTRADELRRLHFTYDDGAGHVRRTDLTSFAAFRDLNGAALSAATPYAAYADYHAVAGRGLEGRRILLRGVSENFWTLLGAAVARGRPLLSRDFGAATDAIPALLPEEAMNSLVPGGAPALGHEIAVGALTVRVVGVLPAGAMGGIAEPAQLYLPLDDLGFLIAGPAWRTDADRAWLRLLTRLSPNEESAARERAIDGALARGDSHTARAGSPSRVALTSLRPSDNPGEGRTRALPASSTVVSTLLALLAMCSATGLLLLRAYSRQREMRIRVALGATPLAATVTVRRELAMVAGLSAVLTVVITYLGSDSANVLVHTLSPTAQDVRAARTVGFSLAVALATAFAAALPSLLVCLRFLRSTHRTPSAAAPLGQIGLLRVQSSVVIVQTAILFALMFVTLAAVTAHREVANSELGIRAEPVAMVAVSLSGDERRSWNGLQIMKDAEAVVARLPGVERTSVALGAPFLSATAMTVYTDDPALAPSEGAPIPFYNAVSEGFFATLGASLLRGRFFAPADDHTGARVTIVNDAMARLFWPRGDAIDSCLYLAERAAACTRVVGVVADMKRFTLLGETTRPQLYVPLLQNPSPELVPLVLLARTSGDPRVTALEMQRALSRSIPSFPFADVAALQDVIDPQLRPWRLGARISSLFAFLAWLVAALGAFAIVSLQLALRRRELGIRTALGAPTGRLVWMLAASSMRQGAAALVLGGVVVVFLFEPLESLLSDIALPWGGISAMAAGLVLVTTLVASLISAAQVVRVAPAEVLAVPGE